jgi:hypothetical protein
MEICQVEVNNFNLGKGRAPEIERHFWFIGKTTKTELQEQVTRINGVPYLHDDKISDLVL